MTKEFLPNVIIFINLSDPTVNRPTRFTTDRATDPTDRDAFLSHACIFEPWYQLTTGFRHLKMVETFSSLTFNSGLPFSVGIHVTLLAGVSPAKRERAMSRVFQGKKARRDLNACDAFRMFRM